ncbi:M48 family metallopeptidase [archaeon]|jgi:heat shock protein HtpX|nr:M48 family metallopeptidase [archaeon]MBT4374024.1 M48 family metallopeptidase [archaeon]MBT4532120.1 M48 family metallopeptidase [archaeon]MBT7002010.1 M48 family metallopeptidase [archaeon]MBT7282721.1 M48 family metallopeptidase [archaeon]
MEYKRVDFRDEISSNKWKSFFLMFVVFIVLIIFGYAISFAFEPGYFFIIMIFAIIFSISYILISYYNSAKIAIASVGAKRASRSEHKEYYRLVEGLTIASGLPMPELYVMPSKQINAFASGRDPQHAVVCVTAGALEKFDRRELEGVLAHELSHVANYDVRYMTLVAVMVGMVAIISEIFLRSLWFRNRDDKGKGVYILIGVVLAILAPIVVKLVQLSISRKREYASDATAVKFTRYPDGLINALKKIKNDLVKPEKQVSKAVAPMFFANPFKGLTSTHPPIEERIKKLERM